MPAIKFDTPKGSANNKGSCNRMVSYLLKEDEIKGINKEFFFNHRSDAITSFEVVQAIDNNRKSLGKDDAKWYSGSISFSQEELKFLDNDITKLKAYALEFFKILAANFNRDITVDDLNYFIKMETIRTYKGDSPEVKAGTALQGDLKPGLQTHFHFIIGRKSVDGTKKLSTKTNHRNTTKGPITSSFDRDALIERAEKLFDNMFDYNRPFENTYQNFKIMKKDAIAARSKLLHAKVDVEYDMKLFISSSSEKKIEFLRSKIEQINYELSKTNQIPINHQKILAFDEAALNGRTYFQLSNFQQLLHQKEFNDANAVITQGIINNSKPIKELSISDQKWALNNFVQILNHELPNDFALKLKDLSLNSTEINTRWLIDLAFGSKTENKKILNSIVDEDPEQYANYRVRKQYGSIVNEINIKENKAAEPLSEQFVQRLTRHFHESEIDLALLLMKRRAENPLFGNLNLFLAATIIHLKKNYKEIPSELRIEKLERYVRYLNAHLKDKIKPKIDIDKVLQVERQNNYEGKIFIYLNSILNKMNKAEWDSVASIVQTDPSDFISNRYKNKNITEKKSAKTSVSQHFLESTETRSFSADPKADSLLDALSMIFSAANNSSPSVFNEDGDEKKKKKKRKKKRPNL